MIRPLCKSHAIRGELELEYFGRDQLVKMLSRNGVDEVIAAPFLLFMDGFGLYRNMYRALMGVYMILAGLSFIERPRPSNVVPLTLDPHGADMEDIVSTLEHPP